MFWRKIINRLSGLNVPQAFVIVSVLSLPLAISITQQSQSFDYHMAKELARYASVYFSLAFILYLFLYAISHLPKSRVRKKIVLFTRVYIRFHVALAIIGTLMITVHAIIMLARIPLHTPQGITGLLALLSLLAVLVTGYLRKQKSSGKRRRAHRYMALLFIFAVILHLIV